MAIDYTSDAGKVRLLIADTDESAEILTDEQIGAFVSLARNGNVKRAAAMALRTIATSETLIQKKLKTLDLETDGAALGSELRQQAAQLDKSADDDEERDAVFSDDYFEILDMVVDPPTAIESRYRRRY